MTQVLRASPSGFRQRAQTPAERLNFGRELGMHAIERYTELKSVWMNL
ncbi:MAG TPA: hypothetical protein VFR84_18680 [Candidatus Angelobacter sp.]|nr:hypothetical protein [Candidatus Angelobacter sp.]